MTRFDSTRRDPTALLVVLLVACGACVETARASDCKTLTEARASFPNQYLHYRLIASGRKCWNGNGLGQRSIVRHRNPPTTPVPVAPRSTTIWPTLASKAIVVDAALLTATSIQSWPVLIDLDGETAGQVGAIDPPIVVSVIEYRWPGSNVLFDMDQIMETSR